MQLKEWVDASWGRQKMLARRIGTSQSSLSNWANGFIRVPIGMAAKIERVTQGLVTRQEMRPNDWADHWPELASKTLGE